MWFCILCSRNNNNGQIIITTTAAEHFTVLGTVLSTFMCISPFQSPYLLYVLDSAFEETVPSLALRSLDAGWCWTRIHFTLRPR